MDLGFPAGAQPPARVRDRSEGVKAELVYAVTMGPQARHLRSKCITALN